MRRVGAKLPASRFVYEVGRAYALAAPTRGVPEKQVVQADPAFRACIGASGAAHTVLALGCADGLCGVDPGYVSREYRAIWPAARHVQECAVDPPLLWDRARWPSGRFDTVLAYRLAHYVYDIDLFFALVRETVNPGGTFVMAGHNARFWTNSDLSGHARAVQEAARSRARIRRWFKLRTWSARWRRMVDRRPAPPDIESRINRILAARVSLARTVTMTEIVHLVDIHRPAPDDDDLHIGLRGFDVEHLTRTFLTGFTLELYTSRGWSGYVANEQITGALRRRTAELAERYPDDGAFFAACWRRRRSPSPTLPVSLRG